MMKRFCFVNVINARSGSLRGLYRVAFVVRREFGTYVEVVH